MAGGADNGRLILNKVVIDGENNATGVESSATTAATAINYLLVIGPKATAIMKDGSQLTGYQYSGKTPTTYTMVLYINSGGKFIMEGGAISGNNAAGAGQCIAAGTFVKTGGRIENNGTATYANAISYLSGSSVIVQHAFTNPEETGTFTY
jgi:hypothetical protein